MNRMINAFCEAQGISEYMSPLPSSQLTVKRDRQECCDGRSVHKGKDIENAWLALLPGHRLR